MRVGTYILIIIFVSAKRRNRQLALSSVMLVIILFRVIEVVKLFDMIIIELLSVTVIVILLRRTGVLTAFLVG